MTQAERDRAEKAADIAVEKMFQAMRGFKPGDLEWGDITFGNELRAYKSMYFAGYEQAMKDALESP